MKIYILLDEYLNSEHHCDFVDVFDSAEAVLKYIAENQSDGHKFKYEVREFNNPTNPIDYPLTVPTYPKPIEPLYPGETYPLGITWSYPPCFNGGPCTNPHHDCINCPRPYGCGGTYSSNSGDDIKPNTSSCTNVNVNSEFLEHTDAKASR